MKLFRARVKVAYDLPIIALFNLNKVPRDACENKLFLALFQ